MIALAETTQHETTGPTLDELAVIANQEYAACVRSGREALAHAIRCGEALLQVRSLAPQGGIGVWIAAAFDGTRQAAYNYMRLAFYRDRISGAEGIGDALASLRGVPSMLGEGPELRAHRERAARIRARAKAEREAFRREERAKAARRHGGNVAEAFSLLRKCAQVLDPAEHDFATREARRHARAAYEHLRKAEDEIAQALGVA